MNVSSIPTTRIHKDRPIKQIIRDLHSAPLTRRISQQNLEELGLVWTLVDLPKGKRAIGTKWVYRNKKDERVIVVRNKARLVAQGYAQEEGMRPCYLSIRNRIQKITKIKLCSSRRTEMMHKRFNEFYRTPYFLQGLQSTPKEGESSIIQDNMWADI
ncbi:putative ribonuclease H-like domain-containing protein [Tanacetum coccineum]